MKMLKNEKGFTLIELVLVIVVLGILAAVATVQFGSITDNAKQASIDGSFGSFNGQLALAVNNIKKLPHDDNDLTTSFKLEVYDKVTITGGTVKKATLNPMCNAACTFWVYVDDNADDTCEVGEWKQQFIYSEATGAFTSAVKTTAGTCP